MGLWRCARPQLVGSDRSLGLEAVVGLLEDGETYSTELQQKQSAGEGRLAQWEHKLVCRRHEKPMILQVWWCYVGSLSEPCR